MYHPPTHLRLIESWFVYVQLAGSFRSSRRENHEVTLRCCADVGRADVPPVAARIPELQQSPVCQRREQVPHPGGTAEVGSVRCSGDVCVAHRCNSGLSVGCQTSDPEVPNHGVLLIFTSVVRFREL